MYIRCLIIQDQVEYEYVKMLDILAHLCEQGGDPTRTNKEEKTAKEIADNRDSKIAVTLLGMFCMCIKIY